MSHHSVDPRLRTDRDQTHINNPERFDAMPIVADQVDIVIGVDTHKHTHTYAAVAANGGVAATVMLPATPTGFAEMFNTLAEHGQRRIWAIEGCGSWGRQLVRWLTTRGEHVVEVDRPQRPKRRMGIKDDTVDAIRAAREALTHKYVSIPRSDGIRDAIGAAMIARASAVQAAGDAERQLLSLANTVPELLAGRLRAHTTRQIVQLCANWRPERISDPIANSIAATMRTMARRITSLRSEADQLEKVITSHINQWRPDLLDQYGVGPIVAAAVLNAWSHPGRVHSPAAFAMLAGCAPIPASSGMTTRHRLNRHGDRQLNRAIHTITLTRMRRDPRTIAYVERRRQQGKTDREIRRCLKTYIARDLHKLLEKPLDRT